MRGVQAPCPACGAPVQFRISSSLVTVCEHCHSVVARGDRKLEDRGKVAAVMETGSPLQRGLKGKYNGKSFELVGRVQYKHSAGGVWDEWYAAFSNGKWGWLAEAQGRFYLTFERKPGEETKLPTMRELEPGEKFTFPNDLVLTVAEVGVAELAAAEGEIPYTFEPVTRHRYADLYGAQGEFATFDYSGDEPNIFLGKEVSLDDIGISPTVTAEKDPRQISAMQLACPQCGGPLTLHAPDKTERVTCPNCQSLLDANQGNLKFLSTLRADKVHPVIPLGSVGTLYGTEFTVIGFLSRSVTEGGTDYFWTEYLLYNPREGFRWLVNSQNHWSFVSPLSPGEVQTETNMVRFRGRKYRLFQDGLASVRYVLGEFYWKVKVGELAKTADFISPPEMLSIERSVSSAGWDSETTRDTEAPQAEEVICSLGIYLPHSEIEKAFGIKNLTRGFGVAPNQPNPVDKRVYGAWVMYLVALIVLTALFSMPRVAPHYDSAFFWWIAMFMSVPPIGAAVYQYSFETTRWKDSNYSPYATAGGDDDDEDD